MPAGHVKCNWEETLKNAYNQQEFKGCSMDFLSRKGIYRLNSNSWWLAQPAYESQPTNVFEAGDRPRLN
eukprot:11281622-Prorocentrum_lima.AAC.1